MLGQCAVMEVVNDHDQLLARDLIAATGADSGTIVILFIPINYTINQITGS